MIKKILSLTLFSSLLFSANFNVDEYKGLLKPAQNFNIKEYQPQQQNSVDFIKEAYELYQGDKSTNFLTKKEFKKVYNIIANYKKRDNKERDFIFYLTSESVPTQSMLNIIYQVGLLQKYGNIDIKTKQFFIGFPKDFKSLLTKFKDEIEKRNPAQKKLIENNSGIKIDPRIFSYFNLKKVPAIVLAKCKGLNPDIKKCKYKFILRGDASLLEFFEKVQNFDKKYKKYSQTLIEHK
jgi:hypothetical protein